MAGDYAVLAPYYDILGMSSFASSITPRLIDFAQRNDWVGRRLLDLGTGTGAAARWLAGRGYSVTGVDQSAEMLQIARRTDTSGLSLTWQHGDLMALDQLPLNAVDMALALDVFNEFNSLRDLELAFRGVAQVLDAGKWLIFDLYTLEGLVERGRAGDEVLYDDSAQLTAVARSRYDYERQLYICDYLLFHADDGNWRRGTARRVLRGFPVQAVGALLQRCGFELMTGLTTAMERYEPDTTRHAHRVIFVAQRQAT